MVTNKKFLKFLEDTRKIVETKELLDDENLPVELVDLDNMLDTLYNFSSINEIVFEKLKHIGFWKEPTANSNIVQIIFEFLDEPNKYFAFVWKSVYGTIFHTLEREFFFDSEQWNEVRPI